MHFWHNAYRNHAPAVLAYLKSRTRPELAEDLLQETFIRAIRADEIPDRVRPYLLTIAHNLMINTYRKKAPTLFSDMGEEAEAALEPATEPGASDRALDLQRVQEMLDGALSGLTEDHRRAFELAVLQQQPYREVARRTGWSLAQVKTNVFRARQATIESLRSLLREPAA